MKVINELQTYDYNITTPLIVKVKSDWNYNDRVILEVEGKNYTLIASELIAAIRNACNKN